MLSESEDELLQIALRVQAERDTNYWRPNQQQQGPSRPVLNYVKPPPQPANSSTNNQRGGPGGIVGRIDLIRNISNSDVITPMKRNQLRQKKPSVDDDDDSDVEILSISSGDEDYTKDRRIGQENRARSGGRDDDRGWDGGEPDSWKRVDEAELACRVREMRETRAAPVAEKYDQKTTAIARKSSLPRARGIESIDPLGLGIVDSKTFRLMADRPTGSPTNSEKDCIDANMRERLLYFSDKFEAKLFLSRVHQDTSAADLEAGALSLKSDLKGRTQQKKQLVKENFDCFVSCKTTIDDIESKMKRIDEDPEGSGTSHLVNCIQGVNSVANRAFGPLFERQSQAEKIRSVQGMLQRFRTLFNLPSAIRGSISKGEYDLAVREYKKAKSIVLPSHVGILKRVLEEVEKIMHEFKGMLYKSIEDPTIDLTSLENIVRLLLELEPDSDPVWHYLNMQNHRIRGLLEKCTLDYETRMENLQNGIREKAISDAKWRQIQQLDQSLDVNYSILHPNMRALQTNPSSENVDALRGWHIRRLTAVITHHIPAFWKVVLSIFSGKFAKSSQVSADSNVNAVAMKTDERLGDGKYCSHSLDEVAGMIRTTISAYESKVHNTFQDLEGMNVLRPYMSDTIKKISKACQAFEAKESAPLIAVAALRTLHSEITKLYVLRLCSWMRSSAEEISKHESWIPVSILGRSKSPYSISSLPLAFQSTMVSAMEQTNLMVLSLSGATKTEDGLVQLQEILESVRLAFLNCLLAFAGHLENIGTELSQSRTSKESLHFQNRYYQDSEEKTFDPLPGSVVDQHQQLLIVLSNIGYCKEELSGELYHRYKHIWLQSRGKDEEDSDVQDLYACFSGIEEKVLAQYTLAKTNLIREAAMNYLLDAGVQWATAPFVKGVRDAAVELLHTLVAVHAEVFTGCKPLLDKILGTLVEGLLDTFLSLFHEHKTQDLRLLDANGFCQLMLELEYFETILNPYFTLDASDSLKSLQGLLLEKATESVSESVETPCHNRRPTRGSDDLLDDRQQGAGALADDLIVLAQQYSSELLQAELERTRINTTCFVVSFPLDSVPESAKAAYASFRGSTDSPSRSFRCSQSIGSPGFSRQRRT